MRYLKIIIIALVLVSCEEYFTPDIDKQEIAYVFDGQITDMPGPYKVTISKSEGYNGRNAIVTDAKVRIVCSDGNVYELTTDTAGNYLTDSASFRGEVGKTYQLVVNTSDNKTFTSDPEEMLACPEIDVVSAKYYETKKIVTTDGSDFYNELERGICATNSTNTENYTPYYRYECKTILQTRQLYDSPILVERYIYRPITSYGLLMIADANQYQTSRISENTLSKVTTTALHVRLNNLIPDSVLAEDNFEVYNCGEYVQVSQYSLSEKQYNFWKAVSDQQKSSNYLFGQIENQPIGNMHSETGDKALGFFCVSSVKQKFGAFSLNEKKKKINTYTAFCFPDTDTVAIYERPQDYTILFQN